MRKLFMFLFVSMMAFGIFMADAQAARFGGGRSFGMSRLSQTGSVFNAGSAARSFQGAAVNNVRPGLSKWLGPLAGFAAGGLLASLFMGHGMGTGILSWLMIGGLAFFVWRLISSRLQPVSQPAVSANTFQYQPASNTASQSFSPRVVTTRPAGFDEIAFLRQAKTIFIRMQSDYDNKNSADIREFTTPEVYAEIQLQFQERGNEPNQTEVVTINAELLNVETESNAVVASVLFSGFIREQAGSAPIAIKETWHFIKNENSESWLVAGVQQ